MTLTDEIYSELVGELEKGGKFELIYEKYKGSKGPLYNALARAIEYGKKKVSELGLMKASLEAEISMFKLRCDKMTSDINSKKAEITKLDSEIKKIEIVKSGIEQTIKILRDQVIEKVSDGKAIQKFEAWKQGELQLQAQQLDWKLQSNFFQWIKESKSLTCDKCGRQMELTLSDEEAAKLLARKEIGVLCPYLDCMDNTLLGAKRHVVKVNSQKLTQEELARQSRSS